MFIQTEQTPNPVTLKFIPGVTVLQSDAVDFPDAAAAQGKSPLAERLFELPEVAGVFLGRDFISVSKTPQADWDIVKPGVLGAIMEHFTAGAPVLYPQHVANIESASDAGAAAADDAVTARIRELLDQRVRPAVARDGGDILFQEFRDGVVYLAMRGACAGCPSSTATLKMGVENMLRHYIPEVREVRAAL